MSFEMDPSLLQDFLTESAELIDQLDADLVKLETSDAPDEVQDLCNSAFRALHTIKGAASFLALTPVTTFAHAAEDALNRLRKGDIQVTAQVMDALLQSADVVRNQVEQLSSGAPAPEGPDTLIAQLKEIAQGVTSESAAAVVDKQDAAAAGCDSTQAFEAASAEGTSTTAEEAAGDELTIASSVEASIADVEVAVADGDGGGDSSDGEPLNLPSQKMDLLEFMVADLRDHAGHIDTAAAELQNDATRADAVHHLSEIADSLVKTAEFFELDDLTRTLRAVLDGVPKLADLAGTQCDTAIDCLTQVKQVLDQQAEALAQHKVSQFPVDDLLEQWGRALVTDPTADEDRSEASAIETPADETPVTSDRSTANADSPRTETATPDSGKAAVSENAPKAQAAEQTIRVEVGRLESLLNLVGQLVLNKNRMLALTRSLNEVELPQETTEEFAAAAGDLDRLTGELQVGVMRTRMQPLAKLFDRYPRVIRDVARMTEKKIALQIDGKETEVDKTVLEQLADPLVHILRNSADHGIESPDVRTAAGKPEQGTIRLTAEHQGSHVRVAIVDDGKGLDREVIGRKAIDKGLTTADALAQMADQDVFRFIFEAGFSTAEQVSDLSGRGVGMDVVRTNINKLNGTINIDSTPGQGTSIEVLIPLTVAIMPAMIVGVGRHLYSIPLQAVVEIVRPESDEVHTIGGQPVMKLRNSVLPLVDMRTRLNEIAFTDQGELNDKPFAVVVGAAGQRVGLMVDKLVGQQEIVIKPLDDAYTQGGPFSGATIREDGEVSLILDVVQLMRTSSASVFNGADAGASNESLPQAA